MNMDDENLAVVRARAVQFLLDEKKESKAGSSSPAARMVRVVPIHEVK